MQCKCNMIRGEVVERDDVDFGIRDERKRAVGGWYLIRPITYVAKTEAELSQRYFSYYTATPGDYFSVAYQATRNGESYGSCNPSESFATIEEARAFGAKQLEKMRKRYARKYRVAA